MGEIPDGPVLSGDLLAPGDAISGQLTVRSDQAGRLGIRARGVRSDDNGCVEPELVAGDTSCGRGEGEMVPGVILTVTSGEKLLWEGTAAELESAGLSLVLGAGHVEVLDWQATVQAEVDNDAQTDSLAFALQLVLVGPEVGGVVVERVDGFGTLPSTGARVDVIAVIGICLVVAGVAFVRLRRGSHLPAVP